MALRHITERTPFITVEQARVYLSKKQSLITADDLEKLGTMVPTACNSIAERIGEVSPVQIEEDICFYGDTGTPKIKPVISVETAGVELASRSGVFSGGSGTTLVEYTAGVSPIPEQYVNAALEMVMHIWQTSQNNNATQQVLGVDQPLYPQTTWALPIRVREMLGLSRDFTNKPFVGRRF